MKYTVEIVFGYSFMNETGRMVFGENKTRKMLVNANVDNAEMAVMQSNVGFGVEFKSSALVPNVFTHNISKECSLVLTIHE